ncbi:glycosyltransferase, partial [Chlorobium ferrooxidans]
MKQKKKSRFLVVQIVVLLIMLTVYLMARTYSVYHARVNIFDEIFAVLFFFAEAFLMIHSFAFFLNILRNQKPDKEPLQKEPGEDASVAIAIPARHEPKQIVANTLLTCINLEYPNKKIYLLDDSSIERYKEEARELAEAYGVELFTRPDNRGA